MIDLQPVVQAQRNVTVSLVAWLFALFPEESQWHPEQRAMFAHGIEQACIEARRVQQEQQEQQEQQQQVSVAKPATTAGPVTSRKDPRLADIFARRREAASTGGRIESVRVFTDYEVARSVVRSPRIVFVDRATDADFLFLTSHVKNFLELPLTQRVGQFPYESALVRKDLLPQTVREYCYRSGRAPAWWQPCFDLRTEFHLFCSEFQRRQQTHCPHGDAEADGEVDTATHASLPEPNFWILKPAQGTRAKGHVIVSECDDNTRQYIARNCLLLPPKVLGEVQGGLEQQVELLEDEEVDKVAQLLVDRPLLVKGLKFDLRMFVFVRSFVPFEAYRHELYYARLANKPYSFERIQDREVGLTVSAYDDDEDVAKAQRRLLHRNLREELLREDPDLRYDLMMERTWDMLAELFSGASRAIGLWPQSSAYYSVDVIFDNAKPTTGDGDNGSGEASGEPWTPQPKVLEVNFMGDWHGVEEATTSEHYTQWADDLVETLCGPAEWIPRDRVFPLKYRTQS